MGFRGFSRLFTGGAGRRRLFWAFVFSSQAFNTLLIPSQGLFDSPSRGVPRDLAWTLHRSGYVGAGMERGQFGNVAR
eukprot:1142617-Prymnesium_polylepis.1